MSGGARVWFDGGSLDRLIGTVAAAATAYRHYFRHDEDCWSVLPQHADGQRNDFSLMRAAGTPGVVELTGTIRWQGAVRGSSALTRTRTLALVAIMSGFVLALATPAHASTTCRQVARALTAVVAKTTNLNEAKQAFSDAQQAHPDCQAELVTLATWYDGGGRDPYPFKAEDDPAKPFLGPIGWWWNTVYVSWFQRSVLLMVLFGWEIFLTPIVLILSLSGAFLGGLGGVFRRGRREA